MINADANANAVLTGGGQSPKPKAQSLSYVVHPMGESVGKAVFFWLVVIFTLWAVWWNLQSILMTAVAGVILIGALASFIFPTTYRLDEAGASHSRLTGAGSIEWKRVRSVADEKEGLFLSPFPTRSRLENFRGLYLPYRGNREEILTAVRGYVGSVPGMVGGDSHHEGTKVEEEKAPVSGNYFGHRR